MEHTIGDVTTEQHETMAQKRARFERLAMPAVNVLYRQAMRLTNNPEDAQDLVQDTYERGFKAFDRFQEGSNFDAWMSTIERNAYFNQYAKAKRRPRRANDASGEYNDWDIYDASEHSSDGLQSAEQEYFDAFAPDEIMKALAKLSPERRQVFIDAAIDGKSYQEVADEQGVKIGTIMSRLNRARTQLKRELAQYAREHGYGRESGRGTGDAVRGAGRDDARSAKGRQSGVRASRSVNPEHADTDHNGRQTGQSPMALRTGAAASGAPATGKGRI